MVTTLAKNNIPFLLTHDEILRATVIFSLAEDVLTTLNLRGLLNSEYIRDCIALEDFRKLIRGITEVNDTSKIYTMPEVKKVICERYHMTSTHLNQVIKNATKRPIYACTGCGAIINETQFMRTGGKCPECASIDIMNEINIINTTYQNDSEQ